jgi:putative transposase
MKSHTKRALRAMPATQIQISMPVQGVLRDVRHAFLGLCIDAGRRVLAAMMEDERVALCGAKGVPDEDRHAVRGGSTCSRVVLGGQRIAVRRLRARSLHDGELALGSFEWAAATDPLNAADQWLGRRLDGVDLPVVMVDGIHFHDSVVLVALGIDAQGNKHVLGLREGSTEATRLVASLLADLLERGLDADRVRLWVIDGGKALRKAIVQTFGARALVQRCQEHKRRCCKAATPARHPACAKDWTRRSRCKDWRSPAPCSEPCAAPTRSRTSTG